MHVRGGLRGVDSRGSLLMTDCPLEAIGDAYWCPICDPDKRRLLPVKAYRNCRAAVPFPPPPAITDATRHALLADLIAALYDTTHLPRGAIDRRAGLCSECPECGVCDKGLHCRRAVGCQGWRQWLEQLVGLGPACDRWST